MDQIRAKTPGQAFWTLNPFGLVRPDDPWHCDIESKFERSRYGIVSQLLRRLRPVEGSPEFVHLGIVGHGGTGKSTQVRKTMNDMAEQGVYAVFVDALASLDQADLSFSDILLVMARSVISALEHEGAEVPETHRRLFQLWFAEVLLTEQHSREILGELKAEVKVSASIPLLARLAGKVTGLLKSDNVYRKEVRLRADRDPADLVRRANDLLDAAAEALTKKLGKTIKLAVVLDNLEKFSNRQLVDAAVLRRADELRHLRCHLVLFFDPADQYAPITVQAGQAFDVVTVPMLPIRNRADAPEHVDCAALAAVRDLLDKRLDLDRVFEDPDACVRMAAMLSGGRLRDVFHLARLACELADPERVKPNHFQAAAQKLKGERLTMVKPSQWRRLAEIHRDKQVANDPDDAHLLLHSLVLNYDSDPWWDIHPLVRLDSRFEAAWTSISTIREPRSQA